MQQSITFRGEPELEESFSFSNSYDFNTSSVVFSDPFDLCYSDDESYIEISLGPTPTHHHAEQQYSYFKDDVEFRISFSSNTVPFPSLSVSNDYCDSLITPTTSPSSSTMRFSSSSADTHWDPTPNSQKSSESCSNGDERKMELPSVLHRFVNAFMSSFALRSSSQSSGEAANSNGFQLVRSRRTRKESNIASINSGGIMKFLVKLRSLNIGRLLASLNKKAYQSQLKTNLMKPFDKWVVTKTTDSIERSKTVLDINMEAIKGVLVAIGVSFGRKDGKIKSSPSCSSKSSPNHNTNYKTCAPDNSIQAAIAHCKSSFCPN